MKIVENDERARKVAANEFHQGFFSKARALRAVAADWGFAGVILRAPGVEVPLLFGAWDF